MNVKIKRLNEHAVIPKYAREGDAGFDLVATEDVIIEPGETKLVPTGLAFELPAGYELQVRPRSGITLRTKLRVALGTVDSSYRGEVGVIVDNIAQKTYTLEDFRFSEELDYTVSTIDNDEVTVIGYDYFPVGSYIIRRGDRIGQGIIAPVKQANFTVVDELSETERGAGGFGSSGVTVK